jgi:hypothetical protein
MHTTWPSDLILFDMITLIKFGETSYETHYTVFSSFQPLSPFYAQILSSAPGILKLKTPISVR